MNLHYQDKKVDVKQVWECWEVGSSGQQWAAWAVGDTDLIYGNIQTWPSTPVQITAAEVSAWAIDQKMIDIKSLLMSSSIAWNMEMMRN